MDSHVCLISAKTGEGLGKLVAVLKGIRQRINEEIKPRFFPSVFVVGSTNAGKSAFINGLVRKTHRY